MPANETKKVICSWCGTTIREGDESDGVSHGICAECRKRVFEQHHEETEDSDCGVEQLVAR
jgi:DNA-directed RNA polymerase subunit RPC12/RpoP